MITPYRSVPAEAAVDTALREADRLGVRLETTGIGSARYPITTSRVVRDGVEFATGCGKGPGAQGLASAHFEAIERYLMSTSDNARLVPGAARLMSAADVARQPALGPDLVIQRWAGEFPDTAAACAPHLRPDAGADTDTVWYPLFLSDPRYYRRPLPGDSTGPCRALLRYTSSLGTAAGIDTAEAVFHGLCELVEHDAVSHALLRWFIAGEPEVDLVDPQCLPASLRALYLEAVTAAGSSVCLIDVTSDLEVPVYLAVADRHGPVPGPWGAGAAPMASHAAERALSEVIQLSAGSGTRTYGVRAERLQTWPALRDCVLLPVRRLLAGSVRTVALRADADASTDPAAALTWLIGRLRQHGLDVHTCTVAPADSLIAVATTIVPGLERFSLVRLGVPVIPTGRGWHTWESRRTR
jgi:ribosomal protein S12 methylthiotransferase accessory factor